MRKWLITCFLLLLLLLAAAYSLVRIRYPVRYMDIIKQHAGKLDPVLVCAVIHTESKFKPDAVSPKEAAGLMQITGATAEWMAKEMRLDGYDESRLMEPEINIAIGCYFLNWLMDYYDGYLETALCAYNAGIGNVNRWLQDERYSNDGKTLQEIPFKETRQYVQRIADSRQIYAFLIR